MGKFDLKNARCSRKQSVAFFLAHSVDDIIMLLDDDRLTYVS